MTWNRLIFCLVAILSIQIRAVAQDRSAEERKLDKAYPLWRQTIASSEFRSWLERQSDPLKRLADSLIAADALRLLDTYGKQRKPIGGLLRDPAPPVVNVPNSDGALPPAKVDPYRVTGPEIAGSATMTMRPEILFPVASKSIVVIHTVSTKGTTQGSGVIVGHRFSKQWGKLNWSPLVVTNSHVIGMAEKVTVTVDNKKLDARIVYQDPKVDLAFLIIEPTPNLRSVGLAAATRQQVGSTVYAIGAPLGMENSLSAGVISSFRRRNGESVIQTTASISPGSSGGGLFNDKGLLIGITTFRLVGGENLNFSVNAETVYDIRQSLRARTAFSSLFNESELASIVAAESKGDLIRWLWKSVEINTGKQRYSQFDMLFNRSTAELLEGKPRSATLRADSASFVRELQAEIGRYPDPTIRDLTGEDEFECTIAAALSGRQVRHRLNFNFADKWVRIGVETFPINERGNLVEWVEKGADIFSWSFNRSSKSYMMSVVNAGSGWQAGEIAARGECKAVE